jgi:hypothetical protein
MLLQNPLPVLIVMFLMLLASIVAVMGSVKKNLYLLVFGLAGVIWILVWPFSLTIKPALQQEMSPRLVAEKINKILPQDAKVYSGGGDYQHSMHWYLGRNLTVEPVQRLYNRILYEPSSWVLLMDKEPPQDSLLSGGRDNLRWKIEYYHVTLFPGSAYKNDKRSDN